MLSRWRSAEPVASADLGAPGDAWIRYEYTVEWKCRADHGFWFDKGTRVQCQGSSIEEGLRGME